MSYIHPMLLETSRDKYQTRLLEAGEHRLARAVSNGPGVGNRVGVWVADALIALGGTLRARLQSATG